MADMTAPQSSAPRPSRTAGIVLVALVVLGLLLLGAAAWVQSRTSFGWFAYAPLSATTYNPNPVFSLGTAALLSGAGALLVGGAAGFVVGRRSRPAATTLTGEGDQPPAA
jgi:heme/copper-type cytochrome/quinol oxidase subunit 1